MSRFILGVTGASGAIYATRTALHLKRLGHEVVAIVTRPGGEVVAFEGENRLYDYCDDTRNVEDFFADCASGSSGYDGMAVVPCSMGTLGRIAAGTSDNLLVRSADVCLKEKRPLVIVPREMPYNLIHLENMVRLNRAGAIVVPASPQFYTHPKTVEDFVDTVVAKVLKHLGVDADLGKKWGSV